MKIKFKQGWSTIPSTKQNKQPLMNTKKKTMTFADENRGSCLGQTQKCCGVKPVNGIPTLPLLITGSPMATRNK